MNYKAFHKFSYGLYIIASEFEGEKVGYIGNTAFQVTAEPAQIAISCHKENYSLQKILDRGAFSVSVLEKDVDTSVIGTFGFMSGKGFDKFMKVETITAQTGVPIVVSSSVAWMECKVVAAHDVGSHMLIIGEVLEAEVIRDNEALTYDYYREKYRMHAPKNAPTYIDEEKLEPEEDVVFTEEKEEPAEVKEEISGEVHTCTICGYQYDPAEGDASLGIPAGTPFEDLPDDYKCPICSAGKDFFKS